MSDSSIPPKPPPTLMTTAPTPQTGTAPQLRMVAQDAPVRKAPAYDRRNDRPQRMEGRVTSYDRAKQELRISTKQGEIVVKTDAAVPTDAEVIIELYTRGGVDMARIALLKQQADIAALQAELAQAAVQSQKPPPPQLKAGDIVTALLMADDGAESAPVTPQQQAAVTLERAAAVLSSLKFADLQHLPQPLPVPTDVAAHLASAKDMLQALQKLPPEQLQKILQYLARGDVQAKLPQTLSIPVAAPVAPAAPPATPPQLPPMTAAPEPEIILAQAPPKAAPQTGIGALKGLMPLIESLQGGRVGPEGLLPRLAASQPQNALTGVLPRNMYELRIVSVTPQGSNPPPLPPNVIQGEVDFVTEAGFPVVKTAEGKHFIFRLPASVQVGSIVQFEATAMTPQQILKTTLPLTEAAFRPLWSTTWPALQETLQALAAVPEAAVKMQNTLPTPSARLAPTALFFLAALRLGGVENWLGQGALQSLREMGKGALAERVAGDFGKISAQAKETVSGEWRGISMPLLHEGEISQMQFYIRRQQDDSQSGDKDDGPRTAPTRFILNLHLSRMGDMQLDGLLRKKQFDLILRSADNLPAPMRQELMQGFARGLAQAEMTGGISFQPRRQGWITVDLPQQGTLA